MSKICQAVFEIKADTLDFLPDALLLGRRSNRSQELRLF